MFSLSLIQNWIFAAAPANCDNGFFGFPHWWDYLDSSKFATDCSLQNLDIPGDFLPIGLAITTMLLYLAGMVAVVSVIVAGVSYITSGGNAEKAASARRRIINSLVGLTIVMIATAVVTFIGNSLGG